MIFPVKPELELISPLKIKISDKFFELEISKIGYQKLHIQPLLKESISEFKVGDQIEFYDTITLFSNTHSYILAMKKNKDFIFNDIKGIKFAIAFFPILAFYDQITQTYSFQISIRPIISSSFFLFPEFDNLFQSDYTFKKDTIYYFYLTYLSEINIGSIKLFPNYKIILLYQQNSGNSEFSFELVNIFRTIA